MLLIISDSPGISSGLGRVTRELARRFAVDGQVVVGGWFHHLVSDRQQFPFPVFPLLKHVPSGWLPPIEQLLKNLDPRDQLTVLAIGDPQDFEVLARYRAERGGFRLVGYLNVEAAPLPMADEVVIDGFDVVVTSSEFGARTLNRPGMTAVHHGVDREVFFPVPKAPKIAGRDTEKTFVVLVNAQNTWRKNIPAAIDGFCQFARGKSDTILYLNTVAVPKADDPDGFNLIQAVANAGGQDSVLFNTKSRHPWESIFPDEELNDLYGSCDALLMTSLCEGFGLSLLEAMATRTVPIAPNCSSMNELLSDGRGILYDPGSPAKNQRGADVYFVNPYEVAGALEMAYQEWKDKELGDYHRAGLAFAMARSWDRTHHGLVEAMAAHPLARVADGKPIVPLLRLRSRRVAKQNHGAIGVLKFGGLGDMLQTSTVVRAAAKKYNRRVVVFCNTASEVFESMPEVSEVVVLQGGFVQDQVLRSVADAFEIFLDVRYVSRGYGDNEPSVYGDQLRWHYENWATSISRIGDLRGHTTEAMLRSLNLWSQQDGAIRPIFQSREGDSPSERPYVAIATGTGTLGLLKRWPVANWMEVVRALHAAGIDVRQVGGPTDPRVEGTEDDRGLSLARTATILQHAQLLVGVEGGMVHLAAAAGTRAVVLFGPTNMAALGYPWNLNLGSQDCQPCWWGPSWISERCAVGQPTCLNFATIHEVIDVIRKEMAGALRVPDHRLI